MADFSTEAELSLTIPTRELRSAKSQIEEGIGDVQLSLGTGAAGRATGSNVNTRRLVRWQRQRTEDIGDILDVLTSMEDQMGEGDGGGGLTNLLALRGAMAAGGGGAAAGAAGAAAGALGGLGGAAGAAAAGPLLGGALGLLLKQQGFTIDSDTGPMQPPGGRGRFRREPPPDMDTGPRGAPNVPPRFMGPEATEEAQGGPSAGEFRRMGREQFRSQLREDRGQLAPQDATIEVDNRTTYNVTVEEATDEQEVVDQVREEVDRDFVRLKRQIQSSVSGRGTL